MSSLRQHWPEYLIEAALLGLFMLSASLFGIVLEHPSSPVHGALPDPLLRRALMGIAMGGTAIALVYSKIGKRSGAHFNPAVTLTFLRLGKVRPSDAWFYVGFQFLGGAAGMALASLMARRLLSDPHVNFVATVPGPEGNGIAFAAEVAISFLLMLVVLWTSSRPRLERWTGVCAGFLVALYITFEGPLSGMSMNPARTFGSAVYAGDWVGWWIYLSAPLLGMGLAGEVYSRLRRVPAVHCAKLHHANRERCIFCGANS